MSFKPGNEQASVWPLHLPASDPYKHANQTSEYEQLIIIMCYLSNISASLKGHFHCTASFFQSYDIKKMALQFALSPALISLQPASFNEIHRKQILSEFFWLLLSVFWRLNPSLNKSFFGANHLKGYFCIKR